MIKFPKNIDNLNYLKSKLTAKVPEFDRRWRKYIVTNVPLYQEDENNIYFNDGFLDDLDVLNITGLEIPNYIVDFKVPNFNIKPRDYQVQACEKALDRPFRILTMATGSGKSLTITMLLNHFYEKGYKGLLVVPNINLLKQFKADIQDYTKDTKYNHLNQLNICGNGKSDFSLDKYLTITTWQTLKNNPIGEVDFIIVDEVHKLSSEIANNIIANIKTKHLIGFTGTIPDKEPNKTRLFGLFGKPIDIITTKELIENKQGSQIQVNRIDLFYDSEFLNLAKTFRYDYTSLIQVLLNHEKRSNFITDLAVKLHKKEKGSVLLLYSFTDHGIDLFNSINYNLNGNVLDPYANDPQQTVYFMNSATKAEDREFIRQNIDQNNKILVANYALMSTGVNIKSLRYLILASPLKSKVTITQSIGRGIRTCSGKERFDVFDIVDCLEDAKIISFYNSYIAREKCVYRDVATLKKIEHKLW